MNRATNRSFEACVPYQEFLAYAAEIAPVKPHTFPLARRDSICYILNHMVQYNQSRLDASFAALSDATRRGVLEQLARSDASITDLAGKFHMTLTGMKKHVGVLERAALVTTEKAGRVRTCRLGMRALEEEAAWIERHRRALEIQGEGKCPKEEKVVPP
jgi:DNA-binding transcriptional ArsR family regulator